jgi:CRISP-associated protein Cas1
VARKKTKKLYFMQSLYISTQGCYLSLKQETLILKKNDEIITRSQLPLLENILIFGNTQVTTQAAKACLKRQIPVAYLSRSGRCYGRLLPIERKFPRVAQRQYQMQECDRFRCAQQLIRAKINNSRTLLMRQKRRLGISTLTPAIDQLATLKQQIDTVTTTEQLMGPEGAAAATYFKAFGHCLSNESFTFTKRTRRPPKDPVNALLSFGYQLLWNHILALIDLWGLDPYHACLHQDSEKHAVLASDLIEQFRAPIIDSLVLYLINRNMICPDENFTYTEDACYLNVSGRRTFLNAFLARMEETIKMPLPDQPRWLLISRQVKEFIRYAYHPDREYQAYLIQ